MSEFKTGMGTYEIPGVYGDSYTMPRKSEAMYNVMCRFECLHATGELETPLTQEELEEVAEGWLDFLDNWETLADVFADYTDARLETIREEA